MLKKTLIGFVGFLLFVLASVVIAPSFMDWNARLPQIAAQVKKATGRDLTIDGTLDVRLIPSPMVTAHGVKLGNVKGGIAKYMVSLDAVEVRVALLPLLSGEVQVERISLVNPVVNLEVDDSGRTNLEFTSQTPATGRGIPKTESRTTKSDSSTPDFGIRLDNIEIQNASLIYVNGRSGLKERVDQLDATLRAASLQGPFEAKGHANVRGMATSFDIALGQIIARRTVPLDANFDIGGGNIQLSGALFGLETDPRFKGKAKVTGENFAHWINTISRTASVPPVLAQKFNLDAALNASAKSIEIAELDVQLASARVSGGATVRFDAGTHFDVQLKASHINVDEMLASQSTRSSSPAQPTATGSLVAKSPTKGATVEHPTAFQFPKDLSGTLRLGIDAVSVKGGVVRDIRLNAELADGELALSQFQLQAPGVTDLALFGFVKAQDTGPVFEGDLEVLTSDPNGLAKWLGTALPQGVSNRLKRVDIKTKILADSENVMMTNLNVKGDHSTLTGGVTVALRSRPSLGVDLNLDELDLDYYVNGNGNTHGKAAPVMEGAAQASPQVAQATSPMDILKMWTALNVLNDFDANVKMRVGALKHKGNTYENVLVDGTLYAGNLDLRSLKLGNFNGASSSVTGSFNGFGGVVEMAGVQVIAKVKNASALASRLNLKGVPKGLGKVRVLSTINGSILKPRFATTVSALKGEFGVEGSFSFLPFGFGYDGTFKVKHPNADRLLRVLNVGYAPKGPLGALSLAGNLRSDGQTHTVTHLDGAIGAMAVAGMVKAVTGLAKPNIVANLKTGEINIDTFLPRPKGKAKKQAAVSPNPLLVMAAFPATRPTQVAQNSRLAPRWSTEKFDLGILNTLDADITLLSEAIQFGDYRLDNADVHAKAKAGVLTVDRLKGSVFGGPVSGTAVVRADGQPTLRSDITLSALDVRQAIKAVAKKDLAGGKLALNIGFQALGLSPADLVQSLVGQGDMNITALDVKQKGSGSALSGVIGLVSAMNAFSLSPSQGKNKGLADIGLSFDLADGVANIGDFALTSGLGNGKGSGKIDLAAWTIDFSGKMKMEGNLLTALLSKGRISIQEVPFSLSGSLDKPKVNLAKPKGKSAKAVNPLQQMLQQVLPRRQPQARPQPAPQDGTLAPPPSQRGQTAPAQKAPGKLTPEEMIRQLMMGL